MIAPTYEPLVSLESIFGTVLPPEDGYAYRPFTGWIDDKRRDVLAVLERTVVYQQGDERRLARFGEVMVDPAVVVKRAVQRIPRRRLVMSAWSIRRQLQPRPERVCPLCELPFSPATKDQTYCGRRCQSVAAGRRGGANQGSAIHPRICAICKSPFMGKRRTQLYCSRACNDISRARAAKERRHELRAAVASRRVIG